MAVAILAQAVKLVWGESHKPTLGCSNATRGDRVRSLPAEGEKVSSIIRNRISGQTIGLVRERVLAQELRLGSEAGQGEPWPQYRPRELWLVHAVENFG